MTEAAIRTAVQQMLEPDEPSAPDWDDVLARASRPALAVPRMRTRRPSGGRLALSLAMLLGLVVVAAATPAGTALAHALSALIGSSAPKQYEQLKNTPFPRSRLPHGVTMPAKPTGAGHQPGKWDVGWDLGGPGIGYGGGVLDYYLRPTTAVAYNSFEQERSRIRREDGGGSMTTPWRSKYPSWTAQRTIPTKYGSLIRQRCGKTATHCSALYSETLVGDVQIIVITGFRATSQVQTARRITQLAIAFLHTATASKP